MNILVVEDERNLADAIVQILIDDADQIGRASCRERV